MRQHYVLFLAMLCLMLSSTACEKSGPNAVLKDLQEFTIADQKNIGDNLSNTLTSNPERYDILNSNAYPEVSEYLNTIFESVILTEYVSLRNDFNWEFIPIVDDEKVYAFSMPGGKLVISTGMLRYIDNESELFSIIAHEVFYTDTDLLTSSLREEFGGVRMGSVALGSDRDSEDIIEYLLERTALKSEVHAADMYAVDLMCPFNYDIYSMESLIVRSKNDSRAQEWYYQRPRNETWESEFTQKMTSCKSTEGERFQDRYHSFKGLLP